jgi:hypothetical protein
VLAIHNALRLFRDKIFTLTFQRDGVPVACEISTTPWCVTATADNDRALIYLRDDNGLVIDSAGLDIELALATSFGFGGAQTDRRFKVLASSVGLYCGLDVPCGTAHLYGPMEERPGPIVRSRDCTLHVRCEDGRAQCCLVIDPVEPAPQRPMIVPDAEQELATIRAEWEAFRHAAPPVAAERTDAADTAWYNLWACFVRKGNNYAYDAVLMANLALSVFWDPGA